MFDLCAGSESPHPQSTDPFVIEDPIDVMNNVARTAFNAKIIQKVSQMALEALRKYSVRTASVIQRRQPPKIFPQPKVHETTLHSISTAHPSIKDRVHRYEQAVGEMNRSSGLKATDEVTEKETECINELLQEVARMEYVLRNIFAFIRMQVFIFSFPPPFFSLLF